MRSRRANGIFENGIVGIEGKPPCLIVPTGDLGRHLRHPQEGIPVR
jgi:hypothetical protein